MKYVDQNGLKHLIEKIRAEMEALKNQQTSEDTKLPLNIPWNEVQQIVQSGRAEEVFSLGDILISGHSDYGEIQWEIIGFNQEMTEYEKPFSMTLQSKNVFPVHCFNQREGFYFSDQGISAYPQYFNLSSGPYGETVELQIHPTEPLEGDVILVLVPGDSQNGTTQTVYAYRRNESKPFTTVPTEPVNWMDATLLEAKNNLDFGLGSNEWGYSTLYKHLNETVQHSSVGCAIPYKDVFRGFSYGMDPQFLAVLGDMYVGEYSAISTYPCWYSQKFTVPSLGNVGAAPSFDGDTVTYVKYQGETEAERAQKRIKKRNGEVVPYLLRSPVQNTYNRIFYVASNGTIQSTYAYTEMGFSPICCVM